MKNRKNKINTQPKNKINFCLILLLFTVFNSGYLLITDILSIIKHKFLGSLLFSVFQLYFYCIFHCYSLLFFKNYFLSNNFKSKIKYNKFTLSQILFSYPLPITENRIHPGFLSNVFHSPPSVWGKHFSAAKTTATPPGLGFSHIFQPT